MNSIDYDRNQCDDWILKNVISNTITHKLISSNTPSGIDLNKLSDIEKELFSKTVLVTKSQLQYKLREWLAKFISDIELVSDVCHYDMVLFTDIFGGSFDLPKYITPACYDINQDIAKFYGISLQEAFDKSREEILSEYHVKIPGVKHNSLYDAKVIKEIYHIINDKERM